MSVSPDAPLTASSQQAKNLWLLPENNCWVRPDSHLMRKLSAGMLLSNAFVFTFNQTPSVTLPLCTLTRRTASAAPVGPLSMAASWGAGDRCEQGFGSSKTPGRDAPGRGKNPPNFQPAARSSGYIRVRDTVVLDVMWSRPGETDHRFLKDWCSFSSWNSY